MRMVVRVRVIMRVGVRAILTIRRNVVLVKVKQPQQQQHKHQATNNKIHGVVDGLARVQRCGE
jgi:hypothetical protein